MNLSEIRSVLEPFGGSNWRDVQLRAITADSREVEPGSLFVAVPGTRVSGTTFVGEAVRRGAAAVISPERVLLPRAVPGLWVRDGKLALSAAASRFSGHPSHGLRVVGVTGTNGKTTTTYLLHSILEAAGRRTGLIGTTGYFLGEQSFEAPMTTPGAVRIHSLLSALADAGMTHAVLEASSHALDQQRVRHVDFDVAIFSNLTGDHLDYHRDLAAYREAKAGLFRHLSPESFAVLNMEDTSSSYILNVTRARPFWYGFSRGGQVRISSTRMGLKGSEGEMETVQGPIPFRTRLVGRFNLYNVMAAAAGALALGVDREAIRLGIEGLQGVPGRLEPVEAGQPFSVLVDYAHTEDALQSVLAALKPLTPGRLIVVFGCGGDRDRSKRPQMGRAAEKGADRVVVTSDNPRSEPPESIIDEILAGMVQPGDALVVPDRREAIRQAFGLAQAGDLVLLAGKGHESTQTIGDRKEPFDDRAESLALLQEETGLRQAS